MNRETTRLLVTRVRMQLFAFNPIQNLFQFPSMTEDDLFVDWTIFKENLELASYNEDEISEVFHAFVISYVGHLFAAKRKSGEAYFYHLFRCGMKMLFDQITLKVKDKDAVITILLHDIIEEAEKSSTVFSPHLVFITKKIVVDYFNERIAEMVSTLSRNKKNGEGRIEHLERVSSSQFFQVLWGKLTDIRDNFDTLKSMPLEKQKSKFVEAKEKLPNLLDRLEFLVDRALKDKSISGEGWRGLRTLIESDLKKSIKQQKERLREEGVLIP